MTDVEIVEKLAEFMGYKFHDTGDQYVRDDYCVFRVDIDEDKYKLWNPLEIISDSWELVEKLLEDNYHIMVKQVNANKIWDFVIHSKETNKFTKSCEESAPRAICMVVLKVIENE